MLGHTPEDKFSAQNFFPVLMCGLFEFHSKQGLFPLEKN
jgi:hypothetical protein